MVDPKLLAEAREILELDAKRTQGPWKVDGAVKYVVVAKCPDGDGGNMAEAHTFDDCPFDREANAAFIARAPDMARIIRELLEERTVPEGWKLVPVLPTSAMKSAYEDAVGERLSFGSVYYEVLAASQPPAAGES